MWTRAKLGEITKDLNWGVILGDNFGYDIDSDDPKTKIIGEYEIDVENSEKHHILIYNKTGTYIPEKNELTKKIMRKKKGISIMKPIALILVVLCYVWMSTTCNNDKRRKASSVINSICNHKIPVMSVVSLIAIIFFLVDSAINNFGSIKRQTKYHEKTN